MTSVFFTAAMTRGFSSGAGAADSGNSGSGVIPISLGLVINVHGSVGTGGNINSSFEGDFGSNEINRFGNSSTLIESSFGGLCTSADCTNTSVKIDLTASEGGNACTTAGNNALDAEFSSQNFGAFTSGVHGGIKFGNNTSQFVS